MVKESCHGEDPVQVQVQVQMQAPAERAGPREGTRLLEKVRRVLRVRHYSRRTEEAYVQWIRRFVVHHRPRHPRELGAEEVAGFLSHLAVERGLSASSQNQALSALLFLYREVLGRRIGKVVGVVRAKQRARLPVVLSRSEVLRILERLADPVRLVCQLLFGSGLRLTECLRLRIGDLDFERRQVVVRDGKGRRDRVTVMPRRLVARLRAQLERARTLHVRDLERGLGRTELPSLLATDRARLARAWVWQYVFPASSHYTSSRTGQRHRHHLHETVVQREMGEAVRLAGVAKRATPHSLRHAFATELIRTGTDIRTIQTLLGHRDVRTTMIYTHVSPPEQRMPRSPADSL